jgi:Family of unknown function (DUF6090)
MINFFRKIRQDLIKENRVGKYLLYAVGEIVLVVIGILIAVQINNWNELRKEKAVEHNYLLRLYDDLQKDSETLTFSKGLSEIRISQVNLLTDAIKNPDLSSDKPKQIIESVEKATWLSYLPLSRIVYDELLSSGKMSLLRSEELREQLAIYYGHADHWEIILNVKGSQQEFTYATAGLLSIEMLTAIENSESTDPAESSHYLDLEIDNYEVKRIILELSSNKEAVKWLPKIYHYQVLAAKVIVLLKTHVDSLLKLIEVQLDNYNL